ncbi:MAG: enoyl-CoA hydratase/isomerase family protein [Deltaproteobacteria bacterium]|nr:enoyl-CoA hydratase/isomerase family protein [Candidatus Zymogenaceae bacterium]
MSDCLVLTDREGSTRIVTINRDEKRNALNEPMLYALKEAFEEIARDTDARCVIVRGAGKGFCAGIDFTFLAGLGLAGGTGPYVRAKIDEGQRIINLIADFEKPVIFALHEFCYGFGLELALTGDFRIARKGTSIGIQETSVGFVPDMGGVTRLVELVGPTRAKELIYTARVVDAEAALTMGLVSYVVPDEMERSLALADEIAKNAPLAVGIAKTLINRYGKEDNRTYMMLEALAQTTLMQTKDAGEGVAAKIERRPARFIGS